DGRDAEGVPLRVEDLLRHTAPEDRLRLAVLPDLCEPEGEDERARVAEPLDVPFALLARRPLADLAAVVLVAVVAVAPFGLPPGDAPRDEVEHGERVVQTGRDPQRAGGEPGLRELR